MNKVIFKRLVQSIVSTIIITLLYSINNNLAISFIGGIIIGAAIFITDYLYSLNKKHLNILLIIIAGASLSISEQVVCALYSFTGDLKGWRKERDKIYER